jgi:hypothetical protein
MVKKNFTKGIEVFFGEEHCRNKKIVTVDSSDSSSEKRATFIIDSALLEKLKALAYWERKTAKTILKQSLETFFLSKGNQYINDALDHYRVQNERIESE